MKKLTSYLSKITIMFSMVFMVTACSLVDKVQDTSSEKIADLVVQYCAETNEYFRTQLREKINLKMAGQATIEVNCSPSTGVLQNGTRRNIAGSPDGRRHANLFYRLSPMATERPIKIDRNERLWRPQKVTTALTV